MPLFMAVSGYVCYRPQLEWHKLEKRARQLLVPFFVWAVITCILVGDATYYWEIIKYPDRGLWFLYALFFISLLLTCCDWLSRKLGIPLEVVALIVALVSSAIVLVFGFKLFGFQLISYHFVFYCAGFFAHKYQIPEIMHKYIALPLTVFFIVMAFGSGLSVVPKILGLQNNAVAVNVLDDLYQYAVGLVSIPVGLYVFKNARCVGGGNGVLTWFGRETLALYAIHLTFIVSIVHLMNPLMNDWAYSIKITFLFFLMLCFSVGFDWLLKKNKVTSMLFLGKE